MRFLFPGFLFALFFVAIPIIIHLFNFRRYKKVYFSNVAFLKNIELQSASGKKLRNRLVLASRILAIVFMVLAFARPYIPDKNTFNNLNPRVISVFIDNSYSMESVNKEGTLLDEAKRRAKEIASAYGLNDKFQILTHDFEGKHQRLLSNEEFINALDEIKISGSNRTLNQIVERQKDLLNGESNSLKSSYIISDFQNNLLGEQQIPADSSINYRLVRLKANPLANISIDSVWFTSPIHRSGEPENLVVKLRNNSDKQSENIPIKLLINKQQKAIGNLSIAPRASKNDTLKFSSANSGWQSAEVNITDFPVVFDDKFYFSYPIQASLNILIINGSSPNPYLQAVYRSDPFFKLENVPAGNINYSELGNYPLIILNEITDYSSGFIQQIQNYTRKGGSVLVFPSLNSDISGLANLLRNLGTDVPLEVINAEEKVTAINLKHPVFADVFERIPQNLNFPVAKKYIRYSSQSKTGKQNILDFPAKRIFFSEYISGKGKVYLSAVPLNDDAGNFARHSVFVPIMYRVALLGLQQNRLYYTIGKDQAIEIPHVNLNANQTLRIRNKDFEAIPDVRQTENVTRLFVADQIKEAGNYDLYKGDSLIAKFAFNDLGSESNLSYASDKELLAQFNKNKPDIINSIDGSMQNEVKSATLGTQLWKLCLILALMFLAAEILLIRFYKTSKNAPLEPI
ncbi:MAG: BatA domain-containing protein [Daejeonella sp.]